MNVEYIEYLEFGIRRTFSFIMQNTFSALKYPIFCVGWILLSHFSSFLISNMADSFMARSKGKCQFKGILAILISGHPIQVPLFHILIFIVGIFQSFI